MSFTIVGESAMSEVFEDEQTVKPLFVFRICSDCKKTVHKNEIIQMADGEICQACYDKLLMS